MYDALFNLYIPDYNKMTNVAFPKSNTLTTFPLTPQASQVTYKTTESEHLRNRSPIKSILPAPKRPNSVQSNQRQQTLPHVQKLSFPRLPQIVERLGRDTHSSRGKRWCWYKSDNYVDARSYTWRNIPLYNNYQALLWTHHGAVKTGYTK